MVPFTDKEEIDFLVGEIRAAQAQASTLIAGTVAIAVLLKPLGISKSVGLPVAALAALAFLTGGSYFINTLRIAGIDVRDTGVHVSIVWLRMLTRRSYLTRTICGIVFLLAMFALLAAIIIEVLKGQRF
jgi:hypothetical protein